MVQDKEKNSIFKKVIDSVRDFDEMLDAAYKQGGDMPYVTVEATPVWTNLDKLTELYMSGDFRAIAISRLREEDGNIFSGWIGDFGYIHNYTREGKRNDNAFEEAVEKEIAWLLDYEGSEKHGHNQT